MPTTCPTCPTPATCIREIACGFRCPGSDKPGALHIAFPFKSIYLSGPMTGIRDPLTGVENFNKPEFHRLTRELRALGHPILNPAELDSADPAQMRWVDYLIRDLQALLGNCDAVTIMPGWHNSKGALLECLVASFLGFQINHVADLLACYDIDTLRTRRVSRWTIGAATLRLALLRPATRILRRLCPFAPAA